MDKTGKMIRCWHRRFPRVRTIATNDASWAALPEYPLFTAHTSGWAAGLAGNAKRTVPRVVETHPHKVFRRPCLISRHVPNGSRAIRTPYDAAKPSPGCGATAVPVLLSTTSMRWKYANSVRGRISAAKRNSLRARNKLPRPTLTCRGGGVSGAFAGLAQLGPRARFPLANLAR